MIDAEKPTVICLTPVKNEAWIIRRFLECSSLWADIIIIADQFSEDDTCSIASKFPKVRLIKNQSKKFNEPQRQQLLLEEAKKIKGKKIIINLDADECLSANFLKSHEWHLLLNAKSGTFFSFDLINICPGLKNYWKGKSLIRGGVFYEIPDFEPNKIIHTEKLPYKIGAEIYHCTDIKLLHYQYTNWNRMQSKHRWYQAWETLNFPKKNPIQLFRMYHHMYSIPKSNLFCTKDKWFKGYLEAGIDMYSIELEDEYYWDKLVKSYFLQYGTEKFTHTAIWDKEWPGFKDPRPIWIKFLHYYLKISQPSHRYFAIKLTDKILMRIL